MIRTLHALGVPIALVVAGCLAPPGPRIAESFDYEVPGQAEYLDRIVDGVREETGLPLTGIAFGVRWVTTECPEYPGVAAIVWRGDCYDGLTWACDEIYVAQRATLAESALAHEAGHCMLLWEGLDGDRDHENAEWWQMIEELR